MTRGRARGGVPRALLISVTLNASGALQVRIRLALLEADRDAFVTRLEERVVSGSRVGIPPTEVPEPPALEPGHRATFFLERRPGHVDVGRHGERLEIRVGICRALLVDEAEPRR